MNFGGFGLILYRKQTTINPQPNQILRKDPDIPGESTKKKKEQKKTPRDLPKTKKKAAVFRLCARPLWFRRKRALKFVHPRVCWLVLKTLLEA